MMNRDQIGSEELNHVAGGCRREDGRFIFSNFESYQDDCVVYVVEGEQRVCDLYDTIRCTKIDVVAGTTTEHVEVTVEDLLHMQRI